MISTSVNETYYIYLHVKWENETEVLKIIAKIFSQEAGLCVLYEYGSKLLAIYIIYGFNSNVEAKQGYSQKQLYSNTTHYRD